MKKRFMRFVSMLMVLVMTLGLNVTAFAADGEYTITVKNSIGGMTYSAYRIFDAHYNGDAVSYSIDEDSPWYGAVKEASDLFRLTEYSRGDGKVTYQVILLQDAADEAVIKVLNDAYEALKDSLEPSAAGSGSGGELVLDVKEPGYYYVTTGSGTIVSLTTAAPEAVIVDKNQTPGDVEKTADKPSFSIGDKVEYTVSFYAPTYDGTKEISSYTVTDTMSEGLSYNKDISVKISGTGLSDYEDITGYCSMDDVTDAAGVTVLTVTFKPAEIEIIEGYTYPADALVTIYYSATVNEAADEIDLHNEASLSWITSDGSEVEDPDVTEVTVYTYGFSLEKTDGRGKVLTGAQFELRKQVLPDAGDPYYSGDPILFLYDSASDTYEEWDMVSEGTAVSVITVGDGEVNIWGLGEGTYQLTEIKAPDGYNLLTEPVIIVITGTADGTGNVTGWDVMVGDSTSSGAFDSSDEHGILNDLPSITVVNAAGTALPATGGTGTAIFYMVGSLLVVAAAALIIAKRRLCRTGNHNSFN